MNANEIIKKYSFIIALITIVILTYCELANNELTSFWNNFLFSIFGSSLLSWLVARITFNSEIKKTKIDILINLVSTHKKFKTLFDTHMLKNAPPQVIIETYNDVHHSTDIILEKFAHFKYRYGKDLTSYTKTKTFTELCSILCSINSDLHLIYELSKKPHNKNIEDEITKWQLECQNQLKESAKLIKEIYKREYNKDFSDINAIGL